MTTKTKWFWVGLIALWAVLFLPNLRTNPGWYGDEGEWMEKSWTYIHGTPRVGPVKMDFIFPYPYPPGYMLVNGVLLRVFGNDIVVARALGAVTALAAAGLLVWIGTRLRDETFGFLCGAAFLVYVEANMNFRWVRSHPLAGTLALASIGFLVRYVQEKRLRDAALAGLLCALATGTNYFTYPLIGAVVVTVAVVNGRQWKEGRAWGHVAIAGAAAGAYAGLFVLWYCAAHGWGELMAQVGRLTSIANNEVRPTIWGEVMRFGENIWNLGFRTPTLGWPGKDVWLMIATAGMLWLPVRQNKWLRAWVPFWLLVLMYGVFMKLNNVPFFFYPATIFLPLLAIGFAGAVTWVGEWASRVAKPAAVAVPAVVLLVFGVASLRGAWGAFDNKIAPWTQHLPAEAEAALRYVNAHTAPDDVVILPKQIYWLAKTERKSMLAYCSRYDGGINDMPVPVLIPRELYWFDCRLENAKYVVMASGVDQQQRPVGIDLIYGRGLNGVAETVSQMVREKWRVVYAGGQGVAYAPVGSGVSWPVVVGGEYLVLANPRLVKE